ncbi:MAG: hypothetical protein ACO2Z7_08210 [Burkholderiaceae bacterium]
MSKNTHTCAERFSCMTHAVDELTQRFPGLTRRTATHIVWDLDLGPIGSDRGIWLNPDEVGKRVWLALRVAGMPTVH